MGRNHILLNLFQILRQVARTEESLYFCIMGNKEILLDAKPRYEILDGLRGVAAITVVIFHCFETYLSQIGHQIIGHGYLAVDFFFVLSGFVIGYAYDDRWERMSVWGFFKRRLIRLHPMVIAGTLLGAVLFFFQGEGAGVQTIPAWKYLLVLAMGILMIPAPQSMHLRAWGELYPFNSPQWSLLFEYIGNILYVFLFRRFPKTLLAIACAGCAFFTLDLTLGWDVFHIFPEGPYSISGGNKMSLKEMYMGFVRLCYPFLCGLLIARILPSFRTSANPSGAPFHLRGGFWWLSIALAGILSVPCVGGQAGLADGIYQAVCVLLFFPLIVLLGAGSKTTDARSTAICKWLGDISYPIYLVHYPFIFCQMGWLDAHKDAPLWMHFAVGAGIVMVSVLLSQLILKVYDEPVRNWLKTKHL